MYTYKLFIIYFLILLNLASCASKKNILYIQGVNEENISKISYSEYKIKIDDILKIDISTIDPEVSLKYTYTGINSSFSNTKENLLFNGFQVNAEGNVNIPNLGEVNVINRTLLEARDLIYNKLVVNEDLINPTVDVKFLNNHFTVLGEVQNPGRHEYVENNLNILEAIGLAGDLTINGERKDVRIIRDFNGVNELYNIDLTEADLLNNEYFQIFSGDVIIVNPNSTRVKNAGIIGNSGTLLSLLSFLLSTIIVINN